MEIPNKKTMIHIFVGCVLLQVVFILALSANFLFAHTNSNGETIVISTTDNGDRMNFYATSNTPLDNVIFHFDSSDPNFNSLQFSGILANTTNQTSWFIGLNDSDLVSSVDYNFYVTGFYEGTQCESSTIFIPANTTNQTIEITVQIEDSQTAGVKNLFASTNCFLHNLIFYFDDLSTSTVDDYYFNSGVSPNSDSWSTTMNTFELPDGEYDFYAKGIYEGSSYDSWNSINVVIENNTAAAGDGTGGSGTTSDSELQIWFDSIPPASIYGENTISAATSMEPDNVEFKITGPENLTIAGMQNSSTNYYFIWDTINFPNGNYYVEAVAQRGTYEAHASFGVEINNSATANTYDPTPDDTNTYDPAPDDTYDSTYDSTSDDATDSSDTDPLILTFNERFEAPLFGDQQISISSNQEINECAFKIYGPRYMEFPAIKNDPLKCSFLLPTYNFPNGLYTIKAIAKNNTAMAEIRLDVKIENQIVSESERLPIIEPVPTEPVIEPVPRDPFYPIEPDPTEPVYPEQPISDDSTEPYYPEPIPFQPEQPIFEITPECQEKGFSAEECLRYNQLPLECINQGIIDREKCDQIMSIQFRLTFECKNANITSVEECDRYMMERFMPEECREANARTKEECDYILRNKYDNYESSAVEMETLFAKNDAVHSTEREFPFECLNNGISSFEECEKYLMSVNMPEECREANATTTEECEKIMFGKYGPKECLEAGILNPEACKRYMFERYNNAENISQDEFPIECQKANVRTAEECEKIMKNIYLPKECKEQGIDSEEKCNLYFQQKYMPSECQEAGAQTRSECDKIMFRKFGSPECREAGIDNEKECHEFMFNRYIPKVECNGLKEWQCNNFIRDRHLGNIVAKQVVFEKMKENVTHLIGETISSEELEDEIGTGEKLIPLKEKGINFKIISGKEKLILNEEDNLIQTAPIILVIDSDLDGLPDDLEKRLGTDPTKADTDGDGYTDGEEVKNGRNPLGGGELKNKISPIDEAILQNKTLGHPKTEGEEAEGVTIENITSIENKQVGGAEGYILSGKSEPNSVVALYIYSDLPLVITTETNEYGNWRYELSEPLADGEHEIYVAINDNTGKVVKKSKPLNFFVKEAQAISVKDFISPTASAASEAKKDSDSSIYYYLIAALLLIVVGISFFVAVILKKKKRIAS